MRVQCFELSGTPSQVNLAAEGIRRCSFPWARMQPGMLAQVGRDWAPVSWADLSRSARVLGEHVTDDDGNTGHPITSRDATLGLAWSDFRIQLDNSMEANPTLAQQVMLAEAGHLIDWALYNRDIRDRIYRIVHPQGDDTHTWWEEDDGPGGTDYWSSLGESIGMAIPLACYSDLPMLGGFGHQLTPAMCQQIREVIEPPITRPFYAGPRSLVFHAARHHRASWDSAYTWFTSRDDALASGRRPCRICRP